MILEEQRILLRDGRTAVLRTPQREEAQSLLDFIRTVSGETEFLLRYPEEWDMSVQQEEAWIERQRSAPGTLAVACFVDGQVVGNCEISFHRGLKMSHRSAVAIAVRQAFWGLGIGTALFEQMLAEARRRDVPLVELSFVEGNDRARALYEKLGFQVVCSRPNAFRLRDGSLRSEVFMQKRLRAL